MKALVTILFVILLGSTIAGQQKAHKKGPWDKDPIAPTGHRTGVSRWTPPDPQWKDFPFARWQEYPASDPISAQNIEAGGEHFIQEFADKWIDGKTVYLWEFWTNSEHLRHVTFTVRSWPTRDEVFIAIINSTVAAERLWNQATHPGPTPTPTPLPPLRKLDL